MRFFSADKIVASVVSFIQENKCNKIALKDKLNEGFIVRDWMGREEQEPENYKRIREGKFAFQRKGMKLEIAENKCV